MQRFSMPARIAEPHVEAQQHDDFVGRGDLQHLRPRLAAADTRNARPTMPRHVSVRFSSDQLHDGVDDVLLDFGQRPRERSSRVPMPPSMRSIMLKATFGFSSRAARPSSGAMESA